MTFLLGPLFVCLLLALGRVPIVGAPRLWLNIVRTTLGAVAGSSVTPELLDQLGRTMASAALVPLFLAVALLLGSPYFRFVVGFDRPTAYFATVPGGFAEMILLGEERGGESGHCR